MPGSESASLFIFCMAIEKVNSRSDEISNKVRHQWNRIAGKYVKNEVLLNDLFSEIQNAYESGGRFYHTLEHTYELLMLSDTFRNNLKDKDIVDFAIFYHDIVYTPNIYHHHFIIDDIYHFSLFIGMKNQYLVSNLKFHILAFAQSYVFAGRQAMRDGGCANRWLSYSALCLSLLPSGSGKSFQFLLHIYPCL